MSAQTQEQGICGLACQNSKLRDFLSANSKEKLNEIGRFHLAKDVIARAPGLGLCAAHLAKSSATS